MMMIIAPSVYQALTICWALLKANQNQTISARQTLNKTSCSLTVGALLHSLPYC